MTVPAADSQKQRGQTAYRVFKFPEGVYTINGPVGDLETLGTDDVPTILDVGVVKATTKTAAIRAAVEKNGAGLYVAVTDKSWKPVRVTVEQTTVVKVGEPG